MKQWSQRSASGPLFELMLIGPEAERWDHCFIAEYPSVAAFAEMIRDPVYREAVKHRQAAVEDLRLIRHAVLPIGNTFGRFRSRGFVGWAERNEPTISRLPFRARVGTSLRSFAHSTGAKKSAAPEGRRSLLPPIVSIACRA